MTPDRLIAQLVAVACGEVAHRLEGLCPDPTQPGARDTQCPACRVLIDADHVGLAFSEAEVRALIAEAVAEARQTTPENVCDEAVLQRVMEDRFVDGAWRPHLDRPVRSHRV